MSKKLLLIGLILLIALAIIDLAIFRFKFYRERPEIIQPIDQKEKILSIIKTFDEKTPTSFFAAEEIIKMGEKAVPALLDLTTDPDLKIRWACVYSLGRLGHQVDEKAKESIISALNEMAKTDQNTGLRGGAAAAIVSLGEIRGIPVLIESLDSQEAIPFMEPPQLLREFSLDVLKFYTQKDFGYDLASWRGWWQENEANLIWDKETKKFIPKP
jgi:hypothetical protein